LRVGVFQVLTRQHALVAKEGDIPEPPVLLRVRNPPYPGSQNLGKVLAALLGKWQMVVGMFHHDLMSSQVRILS
jgi:hypothetical protein